MRERENRDDTWFKSVSAAFPRDQGSLYSKFQYKLMHFVLGSLAVYMKM